MGLIASISPMDVTGMEFERVVYSNVYYVHSRGVSSRIRIGRFLMKETTLEEIFNARFAQI
jgi:hypothetical protein